MCVESKKKKGQCQECMAAETLLAMGQSSVHSEQCHEMPPTPDSTPHSPPSWPSVSQDKTYTSPPTPPPSEPGSMSPPQLSDDSLDSMVFQTHQQTSHQNKMKRSKATKAPLPYKKSMLAEVSICVVCDCFIILVLSILCFDCCKFLTEY